MTLIRALLRCYGRQHWWPGDGPFEVTVGAILIQNTAWGNVEQAIRRVAAAGQLAPAALYHLSRAELADLIRPSGYYNVKTDRLKRFVAHLMERHGGRLEALFSGPTAAVRQELLALSGIGKETADSMLLYAGGKPVFVVDAYTYRVLSRHGLYHGRYDYDRIQALCVAELPADAALYNEAHALLVRVGKEHCGPEARCAGCPLERFLPSAPS